LQKALHESEFGEHPLLGTLLAFIVNQDDEQIRNLVHTLRVVLDNYDRAMRELDNLTETDDQLRKPIEDNQSETE
jgi:ABC-type transporter Mla subunit MlaD